MTDFAPYDPTYLWKPIAWLKGYYEVSTAGEIRSVPRFTSGRAQPGRLLRLGNRNGYMVGVASVNGETFGLNVHRTVAEAFIPNPDRKPWVNHKDGNRANNHVSNLEWCTASENARHAWDTGLTRVGRRSNGEQHYKAKITEAQARAIRADKRTTKVLVAEYGLSRSSIQKIRRKASWGRIS